MKKTFLNWSSGKDAAFALYLLQKHPEYSVEKLVTSIDSKLGRISMHGIKTELLRQQAHSLGLSLQLIEIPGILSMEAYNEVMRRELNRLIAEGYTHSAFGDILLEDVKTFREEQLKTIGLKGVFPLWKRDTAKMMEEFLASGFKAITVSINSDLLDQSFCGRMVDEAFLADLPENIDPCGENGEFHTFVFDGPNFSFPIDFQKGELIGKNFESANKKSEGSSSKGSRAWDTNFLYCDLIPG